MTDQEKTQLSRRIARLQLDVTHAEAVAADAQANLDADKAVLAAAAAAGRPHQMIDAQVSASQTLLESATYALAEAKKQFGFAEARLAAAGGS